jgi:vacuolar-type H+-ATPase subunit D/Vma8
MSSDEVNAAVRRRAVRISAPRNHVDASDLEPDVRRALRSRETRLELGRSALLELLELLEEEHADEAERYDAAVTSLSEELAMAHRTIRHLRGERDTLRTEVVEVTATVDSWESRAARERDRATASVNAVEVERERTSGLATQVENAKEREKDLTRKLLECEGCAASMRNELLKVRDDAATERELSSLLRQKLDRTRAELADALERNEALRQDRQCGASAVDMNRTLTQHIAAAVAANQAMADAMTKFDGLRDCVRPMVGAPVTGLFEFDGGKWADFEDRRAAAVADRLHPHDVAAMETLGGHRGAPAQVPRNTSAAKRREASCPRVPAAGPDELYGGGNRTRLNSEDARGAAPRSAMARGSSAGVGPATKASHGPDGRVDGDAHPGRSKGGARAEPGADKRGRNPVGAEERVTDVTLRWECDKPRCAPVPLHKENRQLKGRHDVRGEGIAERDGLDAAMSKALRKRSASRKLRHDTFCHRKLCCVPSCCLADDALRVCIHTPSKTVIL